MHGKRIISISHDYFLKIKIIFVINMLYVLTSNTNADKNTIYIKYT